MANHRIYRYTSLARPPNPAGRAGKVVLYLLPAAALLGAVMGWLRTASLGGVAEYAAVFTLVLYGAWALARELDPDDSPVSFISMALGLLAALLVEEPGVFVVYVTIALVRMVNRSSGLEPRHSDSFLLMLASIGVIYHSASPLFGLVAVVVTVAGLDGGRALVLGLLGATFATLVGGWGLAGVLDLDATAIAFLGLAVLMVSGIFTMDDIKESGDALETLIWFAILYTLSTELDRLGFMRPLPGSGRYRTPIGGLYLCGAGTHPGGGIMGAPGQLAASTILQTREI